jgi:uncharacterized protein YjbJ (UPF0337 family)
MTRLAAMKDKLAGKTKEFVAEIVGDGKLQEEGKHQERAGEARKDEPSDLNPFRDLNNLT